MIQIGIIGPEEKNIPLEKREEFLSSAFQIGKNLATAGAIVVSGGCRGIAEAASKGATSVGGITVGTPGPERGSSVDGITVEICTPIGVGDFVFAGTLSSDVIVVCPGDAGTVAELAIAFRYRKPLIFIEGIYDNDLNIFEGSENYPKYVAKVENVASLAIRLAQKVNKDKSKPEER
jgi:uncharacterized protein (TIGR00725 family)